MRAVFDFGVLSLYRVMLCVELIAGIVGTIRFFEGNVPSFGGGAVGMAGVTGGEFKPVWLLLLCVGFGCE